MKKISPLIAFILLSSSGCAKNEVPTKNELAPFEIGEIHYQNDTPRNGSIYSNGLNSLMIGVGRSYQVGDIVIVEMSEAIDAQDSVSSKTSQKSSNKTDISLALPIPDGFNKELSFDLKNDKKVDGNGLSKQSHSLAGNIACTVTNVYPNGVLEIKGTKRITLERGIETIALVGHIREQDISTTSNTISSERIANAKIYYRGSGHIYEKSAEGWLSSFIGGKYWPF